MAAISCGHRQCGGSCEYKPADNASRCKIMIIKTRLSFFTVCFALLGCKADISVQEEAVDPVVQEIALAFVERPLLINEEEPYRTSLTDPAAFNPGARLLLKQNAFAESAETELTAGLFADDA